MRRTKVLIVAPSLGILGGQAVQARSLLHRLGHSNSVEVGFLEVNPRLPGPLHALQRIKYVRTVVTMAAYVVSLLGTVPRYDVVHAFSASYFSYLLAPFPALLVARLFGRKALLNYHSGEAEDHLARWPLSRWTMRRVPHAVVVPSEYLVRVFGRFGIAATPVFNFVPVERLPYRRREQLAPRILSNRNLEPMYNVGTVLRAFAKVQAVHPDAELIVAGDGSQRRMLETLAVDLGLCNTVFVGQVPNDRMSEHYDRCDLYVNASLIDNMPLSIIEAFACGLPVVTSDSGGIPFVVSHEITGLLVPGADAAGLADGLLRLLADDALAARLATAARAECERHYVWEHVSAQWEDCYARLMKRTPT